MNLTNILIRLGSTGQTARWVAKHYLRFKNDGVKDSEVLNKVIEFRYKTFNPNSAREKMFERLSYINNLTDFTFSILQLEGAIKTKGAPMNLQMQITSVIIEELKNKGVPDSLISGKNI